MIDLSDGLATDLRHITRASKVGAIIDPDRLPLSAAAKHYEQALYDGEDYELLFTVAPEQSNIFKSEWEKNFSLPCTMIGKICTGKDIFLQDGETLKLLNKKAFSHFSNES